MFCKRCSAPNDDNAFRCVKCGKVVQDVAPARQPPPRLSNHLAEAILATLCFCPPLGIPAILYAARVNNLLITGDYVGAARASKNAQAWSWIAFGFGAVALLIRALDALWD
jgi:hypothetical protein